MSLAAEDFVRYRAPRADRRDWNCARMRDAGKGLEGSSGAGLTVEEGTIRRSLRAHTNQGHGMASTRTSR